MMPPLTFCGLWFWENRIKKYLPQVSLKAHATILSSVSRTTLTQTFVNPNASAPIAELQYVFPLYDGVSVVAFTCTIGDRVIRGVVKEKGQARADYKDAVSRGETAGLLEQSLDAADVFSTSIGNVPAGATVVVDITYLGELKHDAELDAVRFTIPTAIAPRYGSSTLRGSSFSAFRQHGSSGIEIVVDAEMPIGCPIKSVQSPSHPISISIGSTSTAAPNAEPSLCRASATLALGTAELDSDFILNVVAANAGNPVAMVERHPSVPDQRAIMATLVPKFSLPAERPEIVFLCDRSGSMSSGRRIPNLVSALQIFLKSLPVGVKFNICSFGSHYQFLWPRSRTYDQASLDEATSHVASFSANFGGTEIYQPLEAAFKQRYPDLNLEVFLLTDGEIWAQDVLFDLINKAVAESKGATRVFSIGVGDNVSHALVEGVARAGNGFSQSVADNEKLDKKIVRMLKASLSPHINDYTLEVKYAKDQSKNMDDIVIVGGDQEAAAGDDDDFELVEKVLDCLTISVKDDDALSTTTTISPPKPISLFDQSADVDAPLPGLSASPDQKYAHLPAVSVPKLLQAPFQIPPLFPFSRTNVYLLMSGAAASPERRPISVVLRATSTHGPLELEIPVSDLGEGETIHQLAARKAVKDLEEGRGWLVHARLPQSDSNDNTPAQLLQDRYQGRFSDMVEREAVRLGVQYQVAGKWCSFVAVDPAASSPQPVNQPVGSFSLTEQERNRLRSTRRHSAQAQQQALPQAQKISSSPRMMMQQQQQQLHQVQQQQQLNQMLQQQQSQQMLQQAQAQAMPVYHAASFGAAVPSSGVLYSQSSEYSTSTSMYKSLSPGLFGASRGNRGGTLSDSHSSGGADTRGSSLRSAVRKRSSESRRDQVGTSYSSFSPTPTTAPAPPPPGSGPFRGGPLRHRRISGDAMDLDLNERMDKGASADPLSQLVALQSFEGSWAWSNQLAAALGTSDARRDAALSGAASWATALPSHLVATACVLAFLRSRLAADRDVWELMADKATVWAQELIAALGVGVTLEQMVACLKGAL